jgi:L-ribulose-5-phosphate 4-epimerase
MGPLGTKKMEGVTSFLAYHEDIQLSPPRYFAVASQLGAWRLILNSLRLVGRDHHLYDGVGYGNLSGRIGPFPGPRGARAFLITGTQTGELQCMSLDQLALVTRYEIEKNSVQSRGLIRPSSESMTHGAVYEIGGQIRYVFHAHSEVIWRNRAALRLPTTHKLIEYGTPEMAQDVRRLVNHERLLDRQIFAMGGHEDGIVSFGRTPEEAGSQLIATLAEAYIVDGGESASFCTPQG